MYEKLDRYVLSLIEKSSPEKTAWNIEKARQGLPATWNYIDGCMLTALWEMAEICSDHRYSDFVEPRRRGSGASGTDGRLYGPLLVIKSVDKCSQQNILFSLVDKMEKLATEKFLTFAARRSFSANFSNL